MNGLTDADLARLLEANEAHGGSRAIEYGGLTLFAPVRDIRKAISRFRRRGGCYRAEIMQSVNAHLATNFASVVAGTATQEVAMNCAQDVAIWFANEIVEGRASLETH